MVSRSFSPLDRKSGSSRIATVDVDRQRRHIIGNREGLTVERDALDRLAVERREIASNLTNLGVNIGLDSRSRRSVHAGGVRAHVGVE